MPLGSKVHEASYGRTPHAFLFKKGINIKRRGITKKHDLAEYKVQTHNSAYQARVIWMLTNVKGINLG